MSDNNELLRPIILFVDKTHTDARARATFEPIQFTLGLFNQATRSRQEAWGASTDQRPETTVMPTPDVGRDGRQQ